MPAALRFANDPAKSFFLYDGACFADRGGVFGADLAISLDVIYQLIEDRVFETYMTHLFAAGHRFVVAYSTNMKLGDTAPHVHHRVFTAWVQNHCPKWVLDGVTRGSNAELAACADFFIYRRVTR